MTEEAKKKSSGCLVWFVGLLIVGLGALGIYLTSNEPKPTHCKCLKGTATVPAGSSKPVCDQCHLPRNK